jgi:hypothetical protein
VIEKKGNKSLDRGWIERYDGGARKSVFAGGSLKKRYCMFITEDQVEKRLNSSKNLLNILNKNSHVELPKREVEKKLESIDLQVIAGSLGKLIGVKETSESLGISKEQVRAARDSKPLRSLVEQRVLDVEELALQRTIEALGLLGPECMARENPKDIASIAANMSRIVSNIRKDKGQVNNNTQFIVYAPSLKMESDYGIIESCVA